MVGNLGADLKPVPDRHGGFVPKREDALLSSLAHDANRIETWLAEISQHHTDQFGGPKARGIAEMEHCPIPQPGRRMRIRCVQQSLDFLTIQIPYDQLVVGLHRNGMNLPGKFETRRQTVFKIAEKGLDRVQTDISSADAVSTIRLQMVEEAEDQIHRQLFDRDGAGPDLETFGDIADQQHQAMGVTCDGVTAGIALTRHVLAKEATHMGSQIGHDVVLPA